jgi:HEAT repeat protein
VAYFEAALRGDSVVHELAGRRPSPVLKKAMTLVRRLDTPRRAAFLDALRQLPPQRFACEMDMEDCQVGALAAQPLVPFLVEALDGGGGYLAAKTLERLGDRSAIPALRKALDTAQPRSAPTIALTLAHMGDSAGPDWIRRRLRQRPLGQYGNLVIQAAAELRDPTNVPALITLLHSRDNASSAMFAIGAYQSMSVWQQAGESVLANPAGTQYFLRGTQSYKAPFGDPDFERILSRVIDQALHDRDRYVQTVAARLLLERRDTLGIPHLIRLLTEDRMTTPRDKLSALVQATGVDSVDPNINPDTDLEKMRTAQAFWASWWERSRAHFRFATEEEGQAALRRWYERWPVQDY